MMVMVMVGDEIFLPLENRAVAHHNPERTVS